MSSLEPDQLSIKPWYKQFWPWFIISLPAAAVIAGIATVIIAFENADSLVVDDYYKQGLAINGQFQMQENAAELGYRAKLQRLPDNRLFLKFDNSVPDSTEITLAWVHPADSKKDFTVKLLQQLDGSYQARSAKAISGRWYLRIYQADKWLIKSEISNGVNSIYFTPKIN